MLSLKTIDEALSIYVKHQSYPLAIKMLSSEDEIPQDAKRPLRDFGVPFALCQALALGRKEGLTIVLDKDSQSCPIALAGLGFVRTVEYLSGKYMLAPINQSTEARAKAAETPGVSEIRICATPHVPGTEKGIYSEFKVIQFSRYKGNSELWPVVSDRE